MNLWNLDMLKACFESFPVQKNGLIKVLELDIELQTNDLSFVQFLKLYLTSKIERVVIYCPEVVFDLIDYDWSDSSTFRAYVQENYEVVALKKQGYDMEAEFLDITNGHKLLISN